MNLVCQCARLCAVTIALLLEGMFEPVWLEKGGSGTLVCISQSNLVIIINRVACGHYETVVLTSCLILP
uniref:Putative secreted protein n=1 Tax=Ixodes ricinus TaxID=34613 RepID=A0A6B0TX33_IXORI